MLQIQSMSRPKVDQITVQRKWGDEGDENCGSDSILLEGHLLTLAQSSEEANFCIQLLYKKNINIMINTTTGL